MDDLTDQQLALLEVAAEEPVQDDAGEGVVPFKYAITSYGADYPVDSLVKRLNTDVIFVPLFQRSYVWPLAKASRFIESLLLGLPVPGIFLSREPESNKLLIIDGQQRLRTLQRFYDGEFDSRPFRLQNVQERFVGKTYETLEEEDRIRLDDAILHATIVKQEEPSDDQSSIFHIFERLNTGGVQLQAQEIRACIFHGPFNDLIREMNSLAAWRSIYGNPSKRSKDQELILRFLALYYNLDQYERPIKEFLNRFMGRNRYFAFHAPDDLRQTFYGAIETVFEFIGSRAFRPERALNAAVFDSVMIGTARRLERGAITSPEIYRDRYDALLDNVEYRGTVETGTSDLPNVLRRIELASEAFHEVP